MTVKVPWKGKGRKLTILLPSQVFSHYYLVGPHRIQTRIDNLTCTQNQNEVEDMFLTPKFRMPYLFLSFKIRCTSENIKILQRKKNKPTLVQS